VFLFSEKCLTPAQEPASQIMNPPKADFQNKKNRKRKYHAKELAAKKTKNQSRSQKIKSTQIRQSELSEVKKHTESGQARQGKKARKSARGGLSERP